MKESELQKEKVSTESELLEQRQNKRKRISEHIKQKKREVL